MKLDQKMIVIKYTSIAVFILLSGVKSRMYGKVSGSNVLGSMLYIGSCTVNVSTVCMGV